MTLDEINAEIEANKERIAELNVERTALHDRNTALYELRKRINVAPRVSDHAVVRYLERVCGVDLAPLRAHILTPDRLAGINAGAKEIKSGKFVYVIDDKVVVTILDKRGDK